MSNKYSPLSYVYDECLRIICITAHVRMMDLDLVATLCAWNNNNAFTLNSHL